MKINDNTLFAIWFVCSLLALWIAVSAEEPKSEPNPDLTGKCAIYLDGYGNYTEKCGE